MEFSEKWGQDVDEAVKLALKDLKCTIEEADIVVLEEPSKGFLGLGAKLAKVRVTRKEPEAKKSVTAASEKPQIAAETTFQRKETQPEYREKREPRENHENRERKDNRERRNFNASRDADGTQADQTPRPKRVSSVTRPDNMVSIDSHPALDFLKETTEKMGLTLQITGEANDETLFLSIEGKDSGTIIGKRGQTLDAIQYLTSLVVNKDKDKYIRVVVDAENYRVKRENTLEQLADRLAGKVIKTRRPVRLEPMNPYERMVIHATLQDNPKVKTRSEGEEPYRRVIIELK